MMTPILYFAIKSLYWSKGGTLKKIMWCDDDAIKPYFIAAGKALKYGNLRRHVACSMEKKPYPLLPEAMQEHSIWSFGSIEEHFQYREALMKAYPHGHFPVFEQPLPFLREEIIAVFKVPVNSRQLHINLCSHSRTSSQHCMKTMLQADFHVSENEIYENFHCTRAEKML